ncbi:MAG TPA: lipopolysaccharide heptosyltransferase II [Rhodocyclaceae bacterium]|nr:lipopolysaccharide heptosyltransferase II [Rhodocyclaceae bacterium]
MTKSWSEARNILCVRLDNMGDVLMSTPAIRALRQCGGTHHIALLASSAGAAVADHIPEVDSAIVYDAPWMKSGYGYDAMADRRMIAHLESCNFDAAVIFTVFSQNPLPAALMCLLADIPLRLAHCRENPYHLLTDWVCESEPDGGIRHEVQRQLDLVARVGAHTHNDRLSFHVRDADHWTMREKLAASGTDMKRRRIVIHAGATAASRRYPAERFSLVAQILQRELGCTVLFTGSAVERELCEALQASVPNSHSLAGELSLGELGALIADCAVLLSNNTGPVHLAAAVGTPVVDLYALTNPQHTPWQVPNRVLSHDVSCKYCYKSICPQGHHACLRGIEPQQVVAAVRELWQSERHEAHAMHGSNQQTMAA